MTVGTGKAAKPGRRESASRPALSHRLAERGIDRLLLLLVPALLFALVLFVSPGGCLCLPFGR